MDVGNGKSWYKFWEKIVQVPECMQSRKKQQQQVDTSGWIGMKTEKHYWALAAQQWITMMIHWSLSTLK